MPLTRSPLHPIIGAVADVRASLKTGTNASPTFMSTDDKAVALAELVRASAQLDELRLRVLGDAGDLAASTAARDASGWLAQHTRTRFTDARADLALACALDRDHPLLAASMREGEATLAQAHVIRRAIDALLASVDADTTARAEAHLVAQAREFGPRELGRIGRRILVVTIPLAALQAELATAGVIDAGLVPGDELTGDRITAAQARRLACTAKILPAVLGGESLPLDLGRTRRLFTPAQRKALLFRDQVCRAEGCGIPGTWCEAHHLASWQRGGPTDLVNGILLCSHHHHRAHDAAYRTDRLPDGDLRFHRRR